MRITNLYMANNVLNSIQNNLGRLARSQEQLATTKRILRPSDDPAIMGELLKIKSTLSYQKQYAANIDDGLSYMDAIDASFSSVNNVLSQAWKYAVQGANDSNNPENRQAIAQQIDKLIDHVVDLANTPVGGRYVFGGTENDSPPFQRVGDKVIFKGNTAQIYREVSAATNYRIDTVAIGTGFAIDMEGTLEPPKIISRQNDLTQTGSFEIEVLTDDGTAATEVRITYQGHTEIIDTTMGPSLQNGVLEIDGAAFPNLAGLDGLKIDLKGCLEQAQYTMTFDHSVGAFGNATWSESDGAYVVFDGSRLPDDPNWGPFDSLFNLRDNLNNDDTPGLQLNITQLQHDMDNVLTHQVAVGARYNHFESLKTMLLDQEVKLTQTLNNIEGADMARLSIEYAQQKLAYDSSLAIGASMMNTSLLNFLK